MSSTRKRKRTNDVLIILDALAKPFVQIGIKRQQFAIFEWDWHNLNYGTLDIFINNIIISHCIEHRDGKLLHKTHYKYINIFYQG